MDLQNLLGGLHEYKIFGVEKIKVEDISDDSRKVGKGSLFVAIRGLRVDSHRFISEVIKKGVVAVVGEIDPEPRWTKDATYIKVKNSRQALGILASKWYGNPSQKLKVIGVTGTDGKTTTSNLIYWILRTTGKKVGLVSSISAKIGSKEYDTGFHVTNPEPIALQKFLAEMVLEKCEYAVLEVTSHGLDQERVAGVEFDTAVLTNITHEHLDYHKTWEAYRDAKTKLFEKSKRAVILNKDDRSFKYIKKILSSSVKVFSYSLQSSKSDLFARNIVSKKDKSEFTIIFNNSQLFIKTKLLGSYNVSNIMAAVGTALYYKIPLSTLKNAIASFGTLVGRLEEVKNDKGIKIYIDFAHTPNALNEVLSLLVKKKEAGRLISVFGVAGERDAIKRPIMGEISAKLADISIFTAEDPRSENVDKIISAMAMGARRARALEIKTSSHIDNLNGKHYFLRMPERGEAISFAIQKLSDRGDIVVICGKGHEKSMAYNGMEYPWSDQEAVRSALKGEVLQIKRRK